MLCVSKGPVINLKATSNSRWPTAKPATADGPPLQQKVRLSNFVDKPGAGRNNLRTPGTAT